MIKKSKYKPPSRKRYEERNPVFSVRMPKEWIDDFYKLAEEIGVSRRNFMKISLSKLKVNYDKYHDKIHQEGSDEGYDKGYKVGYKKGESVGYENGKRVGVEEGKEKGYENGKNDWMICVNCYICNEPILIKNGSEEYSKTVEHMTGRIKHYYCSYS
jgi:flagellar biosynthesis/type III secretory pathway protein FliH